VEAATRAACRVARAEHDVVDEQLTTAIEELRKCARAVVGVEAVLLPDTDPRQLTSLARARSPARAQNCGPASRVGCGAFRDQKET
jgi:hypothetical protein